MSSNTHLKPETKSESLADFILVGDVGCGKTALMKALLGDSSEVRKTQAAVFHDNNVIDTPGEFIGRPSYYGALLATIVDVSTIVYLQPANSSAFSMPPGLLQVYPNKRVVGVISKADLPNADPGRARQILKDNAISEPYFATSALTNDGVEQLKRYLISLQAPSMETEPTQHKSCMA